VRARRSELLMSQAELAAAAGVSLSTVRAIESGRRTSLRASNRRAIARALGWEPESIDVILAGGDPIPAQHQPAQRSVADQLAELRARLDRLEEMLGIRRMLADAELEEVADRLHEEKRRAGRRP